MTTYTQTNLPKPDLVTEDGTQYWSQASVIALLSAKPANDFEAAIQQLRLNAKQLPRGFEFELPQAVGADVWAKLDRSSKLALGKHVKASQDSYGLRLVRKSVSNHAIYVVK